MSNHSEQFLRALFDGVPGRIEVRPKRRDGKVRLRRFAASLPDALEAIEAAERAQLNVWVGVATRSDAGAEAFARRQDKPAPGGLHYLQSTRVYYVDLDAREGETQADLLARLDGFALAPSLIVETAKGGGLHAYWVLEEPLDLTSEEARERYSNTIRGLVEALGGDGGAVDAARVLRVPGTTNRVSEQKRAKGREDAPCAILRPFEGRTHPAAVFAELAERGAALRAGSGQADALDYSGTPWKGEVPTSVQRLLDADETLRERFEGIPGAGMADDGNVIDMSLAAMLAWRGIGGAEIEHALRASRQRRGTLAKKDDQYFTRTVGRALAHAEAKRREQYAGLAWNLAGQTVSGSLAEMLEQAPPKSLVPHPQGSDSDYADFVRGTSWGRDLMLVGRVPYAFDGQVWTGDGSDRLIEHRYMSAVSGHAAVIPFLPVETVPVKGPGGKVKPEPLADLHRKAVRLRSDSHGIARAMQRIKPRITMPQHGLGQHFEFLNCTNGVADLRTGKLLPHEKARDLRIMQIAGALWDPEASDPQVERFLHTSIPDEQRRRLVIQLLGLSMISSQALAEKVLVIPYSTEPDTGKTALLESFRGAMGDYAQPVTAQLFASSRRKMNDHNSMLAQLEGKRFAFGSEFPSDMTIDDGMFRTLTGGDMIVARDVGDKQKKFLPEHTLWMAANSVPTIAIDQEAAWSRVFVIQFQREGEADPNLKPKLRTEKARSAWLAVAWRGLCDYREHGLSVPQSVVDARAEAREASDPIREFLNLCYVSEPGARVPVEDVKVAYREFAGWEALGSKAFNAGMEHQGIQRTPNRRYWKGIRVRKADDEEEQAF